MDSMNYDLAKALKDAGFPSLGDGDFLMGLLEEDNSGLITSNSVYAPTLSELIDECGKNFLSLRKSGRYWEATALTETEMFGGGSTPEEAVARLWLALNRQEGSAI